MWIIQDISLLFKYTNEVHHPWSLNISHHGEFNGSMSVTIYETESGYTERWVSSKCEQIIDFLRMHDTYGFVDMSETVQDYSLLVTVDKPSLDFIKYVKSVDVIQYSDGIVSDRFDDSYDFTALNEDKSILLCSMGEIDTACTLLHAVALCSKCIDGENAYIGGPFEDTDTNIESVILDLPAYRSVYKVSFSDYKAATRFVSKYVTLKRNPLAKWISEH